MCGYPLVLMFPVSSIFTMAFYTLYTMLQAFGHPKESWAVASKQCLPSLWFFPISSYISIACKHHWRYGAVAQILCPESKLKTAKWLLFWSGILLPKSPFQPTEFPLLFRHKIDTNIHQQEKISDQSNSRKHCQQSVTSPLTHLLTIHQSIPHMFMA